MLNEVRREMLLLLKINEFIRNIDRRMGNPINTIENMMKYIYEEVARVERKTNSTWENICLSLEYYKYMFLFSLVRVYLSFKDFIFKTREEVEKQNNAERVFEYKH